MNDIIAELRDSMESDRQEFLVKLTSAQKDAVEKAEEFGWCIFGMRKADVRMMSGAKTMHIDVNGKRVQEVRIKNY